MSIWNRKEPFVLAVGDIISFVAALWLMLFLRYGEFPDSEIFYLHMAPFSFLFVAWLLIFFVAGLYEKHTLLFQSRLPTILLKTTLTNIILAVLLFYFIPYFGIAPKANLFIYLVIYSVFILLWRIYGYRMFFADKDQNAIIIGAGEELHELTLEVNNNRRYNIRFVASIDIGNPSALNFRKDILNRIGDDEVTLIVADFLNPKLAPLLPELYNLLFKRVQFVDMYRLYEDIFDRIPLSLVKYSWFLENISIAPSAGYDAVKRATDIVLSLFLGAASLVLYPFIIAAVKLDDGGQIFSVQERVGQNNKPVKLFKFRTMTIGNDGGKWGHGNENKVTRAGAFLRTTRMDELPQLWNVLRGDLALIGPRPEFSEPVSFYEKQVPYYRIRHIIKPGLSGWAQLYHDNHPHHEVDIRETGVKLSYDLYYIKNRSPFLDLKIALKTIKTLLSRSGV